MSHEFLRKLNNSYLRLAIKLMRIVFKKLEAIVAKINFKCAFPTDFCKAQASFASAVLCCLKLSPDLNANGCWRSIAAKRADWTKDVCSRDIFRVKNVVGKQINAIVICLISFITLLTQGQFSFLAIILNKLS